MSCVSGISVNGVHFFSKINYLLNYHYNFIDAEKSSNSKPSVERHTSINEYKCSANKKNYGEHPSRCYALTLLCSGCRSWSQRKCVNMSDFPTVMTLNSFSFSVLNYEDLAAKHAKLNRDLLNNQFELSASARSGISLTATPVPPDPEIDRLVENGRSASNSYRLAIDRPNSGRIRSTRLA